MNDEKTASDYKVQGGSVLHLVLALRGGESWDASGSDEYGGEDWGVQSLGTKCIT